MKTRAKNCSPKGGRIGLKTPPCDTRGFTMIEMIGVLAVMAILASVIVPNALKIIERAAVRAEAETLSRLGEQTKLYFRDFGTPPNSASSNPPTTATSWNTQIAARDSLNAHDVLVNKRQMHRVYVAEPATPPALPQRALILSSMRSGILRQVSATETSQDVANYIRANMTRFNDVWNWNTSASPLIAPPGWGAWTESTIEFLVIERINLRQIRTFSATLKNNGGALARYEVVLPNGTKPPHFAGTLGPGELRNFHKADPSPLHEGCRIDLYATVAATNPSMSYLLRSADVGFSFDGAQWSLDE